jgi:hypothetical protein
MMPFEDRGTRNIVGALVFPASIYDKYKTKANAMEGTGQEGEKQTNKQNKRITAVDTLRIHWSFSQTQVVPNWSWPSSSERGTAMTSSFKRCSRSMPWNLHAASTGTASVGATHADVKYVRNEMDNLFCSCVGQPPKSTQSYS